MELFALYFNLLLFYIELSNGFWIIFEGLGLLGFMAYQPL